MDTVIKMKKIIIFLVVLIVVGCKKEETLLETSFLSNQTFTKGLRVDGHQFDSLIIDNCIFEGKALNIGNADYVVIKNCTFRNITDNGLKIGFIGDCSNIRVENCTFKNISSNGIDSHENAPNCIIKGCYFESTALSDVGAAMGQPHHAIYWKGKNVQIINNQFVAGDQMFGNGISHRSSGLISGNIISGYPQNGIMYFTDHPGEDTLIIENNFLINNSRSISLASNGTLEYHNENVIVRFNSMIQEKNYSIYISTGFETTTSVSIYGNIIVNPTEIYIKKFSDFAEIYGNLERKLDVGFVDNTTDLHLKSTSEAIDYCIDFIYYPLFDIDGDLRNKSNLNAGADENN